MDEYISKDKALYFMNHNDKVVHYLSRTAENMVDRTTQALCQVISEMPAEDVQPVKRGKWLKIEDDIYEFSECSECGNMESCETPYCAQCGAIMDGETK